MSDSRRFSTGGDQTPESRHERMCAYFFGELDAEERAAFERELESSPELIRELDALTSTVNLVQSVESGSLELSEEALAQLMLAQGESARTSGPRQLTSPPWSSFTPLLRSAAAVLVVAGGVALMWSITSSGSDGADDLDLATVDGAVAGARPDLDARGESREAIEIVRADELAAPQPGDSAVAVSGDSSIDQEQPASKESLLAPLADSSGASTGASPAPQQTWVPPSASILPEAGGQGVVASGGQAGIDLHLGAESAYQAIGTELYSVQGQNHFLGVPPGGSGGGAALGLAKAGGHAGRYKAPPGGTGSGPGGRWFAGRELALKENSKALAGPESSVGRLAGLGYLGEDTDELSGAFYWAGEDLARRGLPLGQGLALTPEQLDRLCDERVTLILERCRRRPNERPADMVFRFWGDNGFERSEDDAQSTFSIDVDTASYALARRYINDGVLPERAQIRTEEFLNYFDADLPAPSEDTFSVTTELAPSRFGGREDRWMLRVGVRGKEVSAEERDPLTITFVCDTSGSMERENRIELVKHAMRLLVGQLDANDQIALVAFSNEARLILPVTSVAQRGVIETAIHQLGADGGTNAEAGLMLGYELARANLSAGRNHRVVLLSDGVANVGETDQYRILDAVAQHRSDGVYLNTIGVGMGNHNDVFLEQLANKGDGICDYVDDAKAARRAIVERFTGAFQPIASDVKIQVEFDPAQVSRYRLLGYENRAIADADFRNDQVDAGEVGAGHQVVALYELERTSNVGAEAALATVRLRWKAPKGALEDPLEVSVTESEATVLAKDALGAFESASPGYRQSVLVAQYAEFLRQSSHTSGDSYAQLLEDVAKLGAELKSDEFNEFGGLINEAARLILERHRSRGRLELLIDDYCRVSVLECELEQEQAVRDAEALDRLRRRHDDLERQLRDQIREDLGAGR